jgi:hypothetical protein
MASYTWIGAGGGLYATTTNWSPTGLPTTGDDIVFTGDATPTIGTTARTIRNITINAGTVTFGGTAAFTIQGDINNSGTLNMNTFSSISFTGGTNQTLNLGTNSFNSCTINKTIGKRVTLGAAWNILATAASTLTITAGDLYTQGYTVSCQLFSASGNTDRTIDLGSGAIYCTGSAGTVWNTSHTTATGNAWTKFARNGTAYIQAGANVAITGGGIAANSLAGARLFGVPPTVQFDNNRYYTTTGHFENLILNANFLGVSTPYIWGSLSGTPSDYDQRRTGFTVNPVIVGTSGNTNSVTYKAQFASYTALNPLAQNPTFEFTYARATTFTLSANLATYTCYIDSNDTTGAAWGTLNYTVVQNGNASTYNNIVLKSANVLTYTGSGPGTTYTFSDTTDNFATSTYTLSGNATTAFNINSFASLGDITLNFGTLNFNTAATFRNFSSSVTNQRKINFNNYVPILSGVPTISTGTNLTIENPGGFEKTGTGTVNLSGLIASADNVFDYYWKSNVTFTTGSAIRNLYLYSGGRLSTTAATTVNLRGGFSSPDASGGTGPFTGLTIQYPNVPNPGALSQSFDAITASVIPTVTAIGNVTINSIRATTINLNPNTGATINLNSTDGSANTISCIGFANGIVNINNISLSPNTISFLGNSTYNLSYTSAATSNTTISCGTAAANILAKYNINTLDLTGNATVQQLLFDGAGNLVLNSDIDIGRFSLTNTTIPKILTFGPYFMRFKQYGILNYSGAAVTVITTSPKNWTNNPGGILINGAAVSLTATTINANSALNLKWAGEYPATFTAGSVNWRNIWNGPTTAGYDGIGSFGWLTNTNFTANLYGDLRLGTNNSNSFYWKNVTFTALGDQPYQILNYQTYYAGGYANVLNLNSNSIVIIGNYPDYGYYTHHGTIHFREVNITKGNIYVSKNVSLVSEQVRVGNTNPVNFYVDGSISAYRWLCPDTSQMNWIGDGYLTTNGTTVPWGGTYYEADDNIYPAKLLSSGDLVSSNSGPKIYLDTSNHHSLIRHANTVVKNLYLNTSGYDNLGNIKFNLNRYITYSGGLMPSAATQNYGLILNSGASSGPWGSASSDPNAYNLYSTDSDFASVLFYLPRTGTIYFELTTVNTGASILTLGIQSIPRRLGPNVLGYGSGTTITGNNPVYNITTTAYQTAGGPRYVIIDCDAKTVRWNSATVTSWPTGIGSNTAFLGFYDNSQTGRFDVNINWGKNSAGSDTWTLPTASGYLPYLNSSVSSLDIFNTGRDLTLYSTVAMNSTNPWPDLNNNNIIDMDFEPRTANLYFKDIILNNSNSTIETSSRNFSANVIRVNKSLELGNSIATIYGANTIVYNSNSNLSNTDKSNNYITHFDFSYPYENAYLYISDVNSSNVNLSNTSFTVECWIRPYETINQTEVYTPPIENGMYSLSPQQRALLIGRSDYTSKDWELYIRPITRDICFANESNIFPSNVSVVPYKWNHVAAVYDLANLSLYLNGTRVLTTPMTNVAYTNNRQVSIGYNYYGYMSGLRVVKDAALYSGNTITVPTAKLTNTGNTVLLMLQENTNNTQGNFQITVTAAGYLTTQSTNYRFIGYPYIAPNNSELIFTGTGDKDAFIMDSNVNIITNNSRFTHSGNGEGTGWLNLVHGEDENINIVRTGSGNFNKGIESFQTPINIIPPTISN